MRTPFKNPISSFAPIFLVLMAIFVFGFGCNTSKPETDPLAGWTYKPFPGSELPPYGHNTNHLDTVIIDDYQNFIKTNGLITSGGGPSGFYEDRMGQHAVEFTAFPPDSNATWNYVLIYDKENKRIKVTKYGYTRYQS